MLHVVLRYMVATLRMGLGAVVMHRFSGRLYINILMIVYTWNFVQPQIKIRGLTCTKKHPRSQKKSGTQKNIRGGML